MEAPGGEGGACRPPVSGVAGVCEVVGRWVVETTDYRVLFYILVLTGLMYIFGFKRTNGIVLVLLEVVRR